jgi:hypothetical protein
MNVTTTGMPIESSSVTGKLYHVYQYIVITKCRDPGHRLKNLRYSRESKNNWRGTYIEWPKQNKHRENFQAECPIGSALPRKQDAGNGYAESS